jgi:hypothetical protein
LEEDTALLSTALALVFHAALPGAAQQNPMSPNSFGITTLDGLRLYRVRQAYTSDRWGYLDAATDRSTYTHRFIHIAVKLYSFIGASGIRRRSR